MNLSTGTNIWFWVLAGSCLLLCIGMSGWVIYSKRSWKLIPVQLGLLVIVLVTAYFLGKVAGTQEIARQMKLTGNLAPLFAAQVARGNHESIRFVGQAVPAQKVIDDISQEWLNAASGVSGFVTARRTPDGNLQFIAGRYNTAGSIVKVSKMSTMPINPDDLAPVWQGQSTFLTSKGFDSQTLYVVNAAPIKGSNGKVEAVAMALTPMKEWLASAHHAETFTLAMAGVMSLIILVCGFLGAEMLYALSAMRLSKAEMMLQADQIRAQMETITVTNQQMAEGRSKLEEANAKLHALATLDGLTGVLNHRTLMECLSKNMSINSGVGSPCSVVLIDIDNFKQLNDQYGHMAGDDALRVIAHVMKMCAPPGAGVGRYGGEEFMLVLPGHSESAATTVAEEVRRQIQMAPMTSRTCTASIGVSTVYSMSKSEQTLIDEADRALYHSKRNGKNRVTHFGQGLIDNAS